MTLADPLRLSRRDRAALTLALECCRSESRSVGELPRRRGDEDDAAEREAIALEAGARPVRARAIARCEVAWRRGAACTCGLHVEAYALTRASR